MTGVEFAAHRGLIFSIAYRMLGNAADAEDVVQESFVRLHCADPATIESPRDYLATVATRLCIDELRSARWRHERRARSVLPEPLPTSLVTEPHDPLVLAESLSFAFMLVLERLSPAERAVFLLREVFDFEYEEIAGVLGRSEVSCRQLVRRARQRVTDGRPRFRPRPEEVEALAARFAKACGDGDLNGLLAILAPDVSLRADGGAGRAAYGRVRALARPVTGADTVARFLLSVQAQAPDVEVRIEDVNGAPAIVGRREGRAVGVVCFEVAGGRIRTIFIVNDPDKLSRLSVQ